jgi:hypothetical protein
MKVAWHMFGNWNTFHCVCVYIYAWHDCMRMPAYVCVYIYIIKGINIYIYISVWRVLSDCCLYSQFWWPTFVHHPSHLKRQHLGLTFHAQKNAQGPCRHGAAMGPHGSCSQSMAFFCPKYWWIWYIYIYIILYNMIIWYIFFIMIK